MKHGGHWDILGIGFKIKGTGFERMINKLIVIVCDHSDALFLSDFTSDLNKESMRYEKQQFRHFHQELYAVDVTFQQ